MKFLSFMTEVRLYNENEINHKSFHGTYSIWQDIFFIKLYKTISMTFKRLKCTQTMEMKQNQTFWIYSMNIYIYICIYSNLTPFLSKYIKVFQWLSKSKFLNFKTKVNWSHGNKTKSDIFLSDIFKSDVIFHWS